MSREVDAMRLYLGIDAGGTKTEAVILSDGGIEFGRGRGGPGNAATTDAETLERSVDNAVYDACAAGGLDRNNAVFTACCAGVAGYSSLSGRARFRDTLRRLVAIDSGEERCRTIVPDYEAAYWGASGGEPGVAVIVGTGSVIYDRNAAGETHREDGYGYLVGDCGSGFSIGIKVIRTALQRFETGTSDDLTVAVTSKTGAETAEQLIDWLYREFSPGRVAALAPIAGALADKGDRLDRALVYPAAAKLRWSVCGIFENLGLDAETPVYKLGGLWRIGKYISEIFDNPRESDLSQLFNGADLPFQVAEPRNDAAVGAALLAMQAYDGQRG